MRDHGPTCYIFFKGPLCDSPSKITCLNGSVLCSRADIEEDKPEHEALAVQLRDDLIKMLEDKAQELSYEENFLNKLKLQETVQQFKVNYLSSKLCQYCFSFT